MNDSSQQFSTPWQDFLAGLQATLPLAPSVAPFGMLFGTLALTAGMTPWMAQVMSIVVFAGSSQFLAVQLMAGGAPGIIIFLTTLVVNLRHVLYGMSLSTYFKKFPTPTKALLAYLMTDEAYAITISRLRQAEQGVPLAHPGWYNFGSGLTLNLIWQISTAIGILFGALIPDSWSLDFAVPLTFIALVVPSLTGKAEVAAALCAGLAGVLLAGMPLKLGIIAAAIIGILAGVIVEQRTRPAQLPGSPTSERE
ncbi:MAG TPA: AzlC family ABC transporter permease [Anaerolineaceae bacterium]|nr:AzlC family ABC transporter permease [Anaerolineaceae bacterium]